MSIVFSLRVGGGGIRHVLSVTIDSTIEEKTDYRYFTSSYRSSKCSRDPLSHNDSSFTTQV